jgi:hypothetical protein
MSSMWTLTAAFTRSSPRISIGAAPLRDILEMPQATQEPVIVRYLSACSTSCSK